MMIQLLLLAVLSSCATQLSKTKPGELKPIDTITPSAPVVVFAYKSSLSWVQKVNECANMVVNDKGFQGDLIAVEKFDYSGDTGAVVLEKLLNHRCVIRTYKTPNPWSKVYATTYNNNNIDLYLNRRKVQDVYGWSGTAIHECTHNFGYSHGDNSRVGKENSVPYWVGYTAAKHARRICQ